jgi:Ice-binding-like
MGKPNREETMTMKGRYISSVAAVGFALFSCGASPALAQTYLGTNLQPFAVLGGSTVTCTGASLITGSVGVSPGTSATGFPAPCAGVPILPPASDSAQIDLTTAYNTLTALSCSATVGPNLTGLTLTPGVYCVGAAASNLAGTLILNAQGNANAVFVFLMSSSLVTSSGSTVTVINGGNPCGVQWQVTSSATIGSGSTFIGNILALQSITVVSGANVTGRALARNGAVTLDTNNVSFAACGAAGAPPPFPGPVATPIPTPTPVPALPEIGAWALLLLLLCGGAYLLRLRSSLDMRR